MMWNACSLLQVGYCQVGSKWYLIWGKNRFAMPVCHDKAAYLCTHLFTALLGYSADYVPGVVVDVFMPELDHQITICISQYDLFADECDDYVLDCMFDGDRVVHTVERLGLLGCVSDLVHDMELVLLQAKLSVV